MKIDKFGRVIITDDEAFDALYSGKIKSLENLFFDNATVEQFNQSIYINKDQLKELKSLNESDVDIESFDKSNQSTWFMPKNYFPNLIDYIYSLCKTEQQTQRVNEELDLFVQHNMLDLLFYLKYLVDTMREHKIVWGVGRGSSVASYILYLIGVHKIDSLKYNLDIREFLKEN